MNDLIEEFVRLANIVKPECGADICEGGFYFNPGRQFEIAVHVDDSEFNEEFIGWAVKWLQENTGYCALATNPKIGEPSFLCEGGGELRAIYLAKGNTIEHACLAAVVEVLKGMVKE